MVIGTIMGYGVKCHFQQYYSFIDGENHGPAVSHWQTLSLDIEQYTPKSTS